MSDAWGSSASPPPPPDGQREDVGGTHAFRAPVWEPPPSGAFRDTLIVAALAVAGVVGLIVWNGGGAPTAGTEPDGSAPTTAAVAPTTQAVGGSATTSRPATSGEAAVTPSSPIPSDPAAFAAQDALIGVLPAPAGGTEATPAAGVRTWTFARTDWQAIRDAYVGTLRQLGFRVDVAGPATGGATGERYTLSDASGTVSLQLTVATQDGQSVIEVTRQ